MESTIRTGDTLFVNGTVLTMDATDPKRLPCSCEGSASLRRVMRGTLRALAAPGVRVLDLAGQTLVPGFNEAHNHMIDFGLSLAQVDCRAPGCGSIAEMQRRVAASIAETPVGAWVRGRGYDDQALAERRHPTRADLDAVAPDHPVVIVNASGHLCVANSCAFMLAGITGGNDRRPKGGGIVHDASGEPPGLLLETAQGLVTGLLPPPSEDDLVAALGRCAQAYLAAGITSSADARVGTAEAMRAFQRATETGTNPLRTTLMMHHPLLPHLAAVGARTGFGNDRLKWGPLKIFIDGSLIGRTAAVSQPFLHDPQPDNLGLLMMGEGVFHEIVMAAHRAGWQVAVHAIGDRAIELVLDAYEAALIAAPARRPPAPDRALRHPAA